MVISQSNLSLSFTPLTKFPHSREREREREGGGGGGGGHGPDAQLLCYWLVFYAQSFGTVTLKTRERERERERGELSVLILAITC